jgi:molybdopterin molybdotransferase
LINYRQAQELVMAHAHSFGLEQVPLEQAFGRVLAETIYADRNYPPFDRATMDGYALRYEDLAAGLRTYTVVETIFAGAASHQIIGPGECYKIMTGAAVPAAASLVIRREDIEEGPAGDTPGTVSGDKRGPLTMRLRSSLSDPLPAGTLPAPDPAFPWRRYQNMARQGEDLAAGAIVIDTACRCDPAIMGLLATLGKTNLTVQRQPRITLITTGNEVVAAGEPVSPVQIRNSNRWLIEAAIKKAGVELASCSHVPDDPELLRKRITEVLSDDIVILCGGVSAGDADYVPASLEEVGVKRLFHKMAIRPGKPTWCGLTPQGGMVFALPGNPFSCLVNVVLLILPYIQACSGLPPSEPLGFQMGTARKKKTPLDEFFPAALLGSPARLKPLTLNGSGDIRLGLQANALALHPAASGDLKEGDEVLCYSFV